MDKGTKTNETKSTSVEKQITRLLKTRPASAAEVRDRLLDRGNSRKAVESGLGKIDWSEQARLAAKKEALDPTATPDMIVAALAARGFTKDERRQAMESIDLISRGVKQVKRFVADEPKDEPPGEKALREILSESGYSRAQIDAIIGRLNVDWSASLLKAIDGCLKRGVSKKGFYAELKDMGYARAAISAWVRKNRVDWNDQAVIRALMFVGLDMGTELLPMELEYEDFTSSQIEHALQAFARPDQELADRMTQWYLQEFGISEADLREHLKCAGFSRQQIDEACKKAGIREMNWLDASVSAIRKLIEIEDSTSRSETARILREDGYSEKQISHAFQVIRPAWQDHAYRNAQDAQLDELVLAEHSMRSYLYREGFRKPDIEFALKKMYGGRSERAAAFNDACLLGKEFYSRKEIAEALSEGGYSDEVITSTMARLFFDWNEHALRQLNEILTEITAEGLAPFPKIVRSLLSEESGFTAEEVEDAMSRVDFPWEVSALNDIESYLQAGAGRSWIEKTLRERGYTDAAISSAEEIGCIDDVDWFGVAQHALSSALADSPLNPDEIRSMLLDRGLSVAAVDYAFAHTVIPGNTDWLNRALAFARRLEDENHYSKRELTDELKSYYLSDATIADVMEKGHFDFVRAGTDLITELIDETDGDIELDEMRAVLASHGFDSRQIKRILSKVEMHSDYINIYSSGRTPI